MKSFVGTLAPLLLLSTAALVTAQDDVPPFSGCNATDYYADLLAQKPNVTTWTREDVFDLILRTHRRQLPNIATVNGDDDILVALVDLYPGSVEETVRLIYRDIDFPAVPAGSPNTWRREDLWPIGRGVQRTSPALTDVHGKIPADYTVLFIKGQLFFGECGTVNYPGLCREPATVESANDTQSDGKVFAPPLASRGDVARALFYTELRYQASLGLTLTDCPPFGPTEFGYLSALLNWHMDDPVSDEELQRNDRRCVRWQGNRNPFVDYPQLVELFFEGPDTIPEGTIAYSKCIEPTSSPTATPNACSALRAGDAPVFLVNSDDPDQIIFYSLANIDADVEYLYVTDNAWNGQSFVETEGVMRFEIPEEGIDQGQSFGFGSGSPYAEYWEKVGGDSNNFSLSTEGDNFFIYCIDADGLPNFLWGYSFNGPWKEAGLSDEEYGEGFSALPEALEVVGNNAFEHEDNCAYTGELGGRKTALQVQFMDRDEYECVNDERIIVIDENFNRGTPPAASRSMSYVWAAAMGLVGTVIALVM